MVIDPRSGKSKMAFVPSLCLCAGRTGLIPSLESDRESIVGFIIFEAIALFQNPTVLSLHSRRMESIDHFLFYYRHI